MNDKGLISCYALAAACVNELPFYIPAKKAVEFIKSGQGGEHTSKITQREIDKAIEICKLLCTLRIFLDQKVLLWEAYYQRLKGELAACALAATLDNTISVMEKTARNSPEFRQLANAAIALSPYSKSMQRSQETAKAFKELHVLYSWIISGNIIIDAFISVLGFPLFGELKTSNEAIKQIDKKVVDYNVAFIVLEVAQEGKSKTAKEAGFNIIDCSKKRNSCENLERELKNALLTENEDFLKLENLFSLVDPTLTINYVMFCEGDNVS